MLSVFKNLVPVPSALSAEDKYKLHIDTLKKEMQDMSLSVIVASNRECAFCSACTVLNFTEHRAFTWIARNPTGQSIAGKDLEDLVSLSRDKVSIVMDEFYEWYLVALAIREGPA